MKKEIIFLLIVAGIAYWRLKPVSVEKADPEELAVYSKKISGKWRYDSLFMKKEIQTYWDSVQIVANRIMPGSAKHLKARLSGGPAQFLETLYYRREEYFPDGKLTSSYIAGKDVGGTGKYSFSPGLDSLYILGWEGEVKESLKIESLTETTLMLIKVMYLPTKEENERHMYKLRCKYVRDKG